MTAPLEFTSTGPISGDGIARYTASYATPVAGTLWDRAAPPTEEQT